MFQPIEQEKENLKPAKKKKKSSYESNIRMTEGSILFFRIFYMSSVTKYIFILSIVIKLCTTAQICI